MRTVPLSFYLTNYNNTGEPYPGGLAVLRHPAYDPAHPVRLKRLGQFAADHLGYAYDNAEIGRIAARIGASLFGIGAGDVERDRDFICSEFRWELDRAYGLDVPYDDRGFIAPADYARWDPVWLVGVLRGAA